MTSLLQHPAIRELLSQLPALFRPAITTFLSEHHLTIGNIIKQEQQDNWFVTWIAIALPDSSLLLAAQVQSAFAPDVSRVQCMRASVIDTEFLESATTVLITELTEGMR